MEASRRSFVTGLVALVAAPAIVRAGSLMPVNAALVPGNAYLTIDQITRESVRLFKNSNEFIANLLPYEPGCEPVRVDVLYGAKGFVGGEQWSSEECRAIIGRTLRIRLPNDFTVIDGPRLRSDGLLRYNKVRRSIDVVPQIPDSLALAAAAVAVAPVVLAKPVTRRFWAK